MPPLKAQLLLEESLSAYFPEMVFTDSGITVQLHQNTQLLLALAALTCWHWPAGLFTALSIALIWSVKTLKATPRPQRKGGPVIKKYYFWN